MAQSNAGSAVAPAHDQSGRVASIWKDRRLGIALVLSGAALAGAFVNVVLPRGPTTQTQALLVLVGSVIVGVLVGVGMRSRWALLLAPLIHIIALELTRPHLLGPTVGAIRLDETYGVLAFLLGRGLYGLVAIIPMILGAYLGTVVARELLGATPPSGSVFVRWIPPALATLALVALTIWIAIPASTPPILGTDGNPLPGSITELTTVRLGGHDQTIMIRGYSADKPVLLYLNGGPGQSGLPFTRVVLDDLSRDFVIVDWDQRGTGKSYGAIDPTTTLTLDQAINDTIELTNYLRQRFDEPKIYVVGESWGSILGVLAVQRQPDLFYAFIGSGQMVSVRETDQRIYQDVIDLATRNGDQALAAKMRNYGQPPYADIPFANAFVMEQYDALYQPYTPSQAYIALGSASGIGPYGVLASEYNLVEKFNVLRGLLDTFTVLYPQLQELDFRRDVPRLAVPVYLLDGKAELSARRDLALEWFSALQAPGKQLFPIENAAHSVAFEQFEQFDTIMRKTILPATYRGR
jgi:pimeloyl-ACP methyl ester carboxylesterase